MPHRREAVGLMAFWIGLAVSSCTFQANSPRSSAIPNNAIQPADVRRMAQPKHLVAVGSESDCVLTTGDIHLWCNWITQYY